MYGKKFFFDASVIGVHTISQLRSIILNDAAVFSRNRGNHTIRRCHIALWHAYKLRACLFRMRHAVILSCKCYTQITAALGLNG